jgi:hypothetical protein
VHSALLEEGELAILVPDSVAAIIEVKPTLSVTELRTALDLLSPDWWVYWPYTPQDSLTGRPQQVPNAPFRAIFAYSAQSTEVTLPLLQNNGLVTNSRQVSAIRYWPLARSFHGLSRSVPPMLPATNHSAAESKLRRHPISDSFLPTDLCSRRSPSRRVGGPKPRRVPPRTPRRCGPHGQARPSDP